jgi:putative Mn2+ efflux pump MntP
LQWTFQWQSSVNRFPGLKMPSLQCATRLHGALAAASVGSAVSIMSFASPLPLLLASTCFAYLGWTECQQQLVNVDDSSSSSSKSSDGLTCFMAVPMTLNNLASGVAGGVAGMDAKLIFGGALVASLLAMACGHFLGNRIGSLQFRKSNASLVAAVIYFTLSLVTLFEAFR